jgi:peptidoglycan hydrolase-like protein with peptidoglycan-binding domain
MPHVPPSAGRAPRLIAVLLVLLVVGASTPAGAQEATHAFGDMVDYPLAFPVGGDATTGARSGFWDSRADGTHHAQDILAPKLTPVYAAAGGTIAYVNYSGNPADLNPERCCTLILAHDDGWESWYIHLNNDSPGTDDGLAWGIAEGIVPGARVTAGQVIGWVGDSGNAEDTAPHLHFELHDAYAVKVDPYPSLLMAQNGGAGVCARSEAAPLADLLEPGVTLGRGMRGPAVFELQGFLATRGYQVGAIDGIFGELTYRAVGSFQRSQGLKTDGVVGSQTRAAIAAFTQRRALASLLDPNGRVLADGIRGPDVGELKRWLRAAGYDPGPRPYNGVFDALAASALTSFQASVGLPADGRLDSATRAALLNALWLVRPDGCG